MRQRLSLELDRYVTDVLMRDLVEHDRAPSAFLVYIFLYAQGAFGKSKVPVAIGLREVAERTGLSKSAVQSAIAVLKRRQLISLHSRGNEQGSYRVLRPWLDWRQFRPPSGTKLLTPKRPRREGRKQ